MYVLKLFIIYYFWLPPMDFILKQDSPFQPIMIYFNCIYNLYSFKLLTLKLKLPIITIYKFILFCIEF